MSEFASIPPRNENPNGLHGKYYISRVDGIEVDPLAVYFVLRLDSHSDDVGHMMACRAAALAYADYVQSGDPSVQHLAQIGADLRDMLLEPTDNDLDEPTPPVQILPEMEKRVESGAIRFGDDWPGLFVRGDDCMALERALLSLNQVFQRVTLTDDERLAFNSFSEILTTIQDHVFIYTNSQTVGL